MLSLTSIRTAVILAALAAVSVCPAVHAANSSTGTLTGSSLKLLSPARPASMADAFTAISGDNACIDHNPSGLIDLKNGELSSSYSSWFMGISSANMSYATSNRDMAYGISLDYINMGDIAETTSGNPLGTGNTYSLYSYDIKFALAKKVSSDLTAGAAVKYLNETIATYDQTGLAVDAGLLWKMNQRYSFGISAVNIAGALNGSKIAGGYSAGISYRAYPLLAAIDLVLPNDNASHFRLGAEYNFNPMLAVRLGMTTKSEDAAGGTLSAGLGLKMSTYSFDYAYVPYGDLGQTHRFTMSFDLSSAITVGKKSTDGKVEVTETVRPAEKPAKDITIKGKTWKRL